MKKAIILFVAAVAVSAVAQEPVYQFSFDDTDHMRFAGNNKVTIFPAGERVKPMLESSLQKKIKAADHVSGIVLKTSDPDIAIQDIMNQVSEKTGEKLGRIWNSNLKKADPVRILMGAGRSTTWYFVLAPLPDGDYVLTISYLIEEAKDS